MPTGTHLSNDVTRTSQLSRKPISLRQAADRFLGRQDSQFKIGTYQEYEFAILVLREYINGFGEVLLRAGGVMPTLEKRARRATHTWDLYEPAQIAHLLPGFRYFFLEYKVNAAPEMKRQLLMIIRDFLGWLVKRQYISIEAMLEFERSDSSLLFDAAHARQILRNWMTHRQARINVEDVKSAEPLYVVSRVKSGRVWFIYLDGTACGGAKYDEFGPVSIPCGATDIIRPGWCIETSFEKRSGRWEMSTVGEVLAV